MLFATTIFVILLHIAVGERSSSTRTYEYPETQIFTDYRHNDEIPLLIYTRCNSSQPKLGWRCIVTMKVDAFEESAGETKECQVNLRAEMTYGVINDIYYKQAFGRDKVLLVWTETQSASDSEDDIEISILKVAVVHMFNNCRIFQANIRKDVGRPLRYFDQKYINIVTFDNTFEMRLGKLKEDCKSEYPDVDEYRLHKFDDRARKIGEAEYWPMPYLNGLYQLYTMEALEFDRPEKGYFVASQNTSHILIELVTNTPCSNRHLWMWKNFSKPIFRWSLANEAIGFCYVHANASFGCWQSDQKGHIYTLMNFTLVVPCKTHLSAVYNLRNGRLLLVAPGCSKSNCHKSGISKDYDNFYLMEVDGKSNVNLVEDHFENKCHGQDNIALTSLFENKQGRYCIVRICRSIKPRKLVKSRVESSVRCYSRDEFSKCTMCL